MSGASHNRWLPRGVVLGTALLLTFALLSVLFSQTSGVGATRMPDSAPFVTLDLRFVDGADGAVEVYYADEQHPLKVFPPGTQGFLRGTLRGLARYRKPYEVDSAVPFRLTRWADGRLSLSDPVSGESVDLEAFGPDNAGVFVELVAAAQSAGKIEAQQTLEERPHDRGKDRGKDRGQNRG